MDTLWTAATPPRRRTPTARWCVAVPQNCCTQRHFSSRFLFSSYFFVSGRSFLKEDGRWRKNESALLEWNPSNACNNFIGKFFFHLTFLKTNYTGDNSTRMTQAVGLHQLSVGNTGPGYSLLQFGLQEIFYLGQVLPSNDVLTFDWA